jgi:hypothetical protein
MSYQIFDNGASLWIGNEGRIKLVMKKAIIDVRVLRHSLLKLSTRNPLQSVYLPFTEVSFPQHQDIIALRDSINSMISSCVCQSSGSSQPVP